ncbi:MAG TPA: mechanosensitive ion channel family protein [Acidimicrobiales bacterium]|nr:mechanosensitive ion channel family protein [Acidimicrobiales bacterium]
MLLQTDPADVAAACGDDASWVCKRVLDVTDSESLAEASDLLFGTIGKIVLVLLLAWIVSRLLSRAIDRFTVRVTNPSAASEALGKIRRRAGSMVVDATAFSTRAAARAKTLAQVLRSVTTGVIWAIAAMTILGELGIDLGPLIASAGIAGVALGFGAQSLVKDFLSGFFMLVEDQYGVGDIVDLGEASGTVEEVSLRVTRLRDVNGTVWHVPNGAITRVGNKSQQWARALLDVNVAYGTDIDLAQRLIKQTADELWHDPEWSEMVLEEPEVWGVEQLALDAIHIRLVVKTKPAQQFTITRELRRRILRVFEENDIEVPNGQRLMIREDREDPDDAVAPNPAADPKP